MVGIPTSILIPALVAFLTVALGTVSLVLLWEWLQEQQRKRNMVDQLRSLANDPAILGWDARPFSGPRCCSLPGSVQLSLGSRSFGMPHSCSSRPE